MISFRVRTNLPDVIDYVNQLNNEIQYVIVNAIEQSKEEIYTDLTTTFGIGGDDLNIEFSYDGGAYKLSIDGVNQYQLYNNVGVDMDYLLSYVETKMLDRIQSAINQAGFGSGD